MGYKTDIFEVRYKKRNLVRSILSMEYTFSEVNMESILMRQKIIRFTITHVESRSVLYHALDALKELSNVCVTVQSWIEKREPT